MLKEILKETGRKNRWVAKKMGVSECLVSLWINGHRRILSKYRKRLAEILGIPVFMLKEKEK